MIEVGRSEQMIIKMDKLANEDHTYTASREEIEFYRGNWWIHTNVAHVDSVPTRYEPKFKKSVVNNAAPEASRGQKEARSIGTNLFILVFLALAFKLVGSLILSTHLKNGMTTDNTGEPVFWWLNIYLRNESHVQKNLEFLS